MTKFKRNYNFYINQQDIMRWIRPGTSTKNTSLSYKTSILHLALGKTLRKQVIIWALQESFKGCTSLRQDTMPCNYPFSWPWNRKWDISGKKCFHPTPLLQNNKVSNASLSQMFAKALHWNCCSNQSAYWKFLGFGNNFCKIPDYIFLEKITNLLRTKNLKEKIWSLNLRFLLHSISLSQDHP